jgi:hypothetical protein
MSVFMKNKFRIDFILLSLILSIVADAQNLKLGELFNEGVVLQRNSKVSVWGTSSRQPIYQSTFSVNNANPKAIKMVHGTSGYRL